MATFRQFDLILILSYYQNVPHRCDAAHKYIYTYYLRDLFCFTFDFHNYFVSLRMKLQRS